MTDDQPAIRPTQERLRHADHLADDGQATKEKPYQRPTRLGTAWDRYCRDRDSNGRLLADEDMILTRTQIATGTAYLEAVEKCRWGGAVASRMEAGVSGTYKGPPATCLDRAGDRDRMAAKVRPRYLLSLLEAVMFEGYSAETWAGATGRHPKSGMALLRTTLDMMGED